MVRPYSGSSLYKLLVHNNIFLIKLTVYCNKIPEKLTVYHKFIPCGHRIEYHAGAHEARDH